MRWGPHEVIMCNGSSLVELGRTMQRESATNLGHPTNLLNDRRVKLAGHILRSNNSDPLRRVSYERNSVQNYNVGKRRMGVPRMSGYCILADMLGRKLIEESSKMLWNKITACWNLQEAVNFEYRRRMPTVSPTCLNSGTEPWQSKT